MARTITKNNKQIYIGKNRHELADLAIIKWHEIADESIKNEEIFTVALSGGKTPVEFYQKLNNENLPWDKIHIFLVDERMVPLDHPDSNFRLIKENLSKANHIYPIKDANQYLQTLTKFFQLDHHYLPKFDLIMLGIGEEGHTASLFPGDSALLETAQLAITVKNDLVEHERVTLTFPVINNARNIIFLVAGENKAWAVQETFEHDVSIPAANVKPKQGNLFFFIDETIWNLCTI